MKAEKLIAAAGINGRNKSDGNNNVKRPPKVLDKSAGQRRE